MKNVSDRIFQTLSPLISAVLLAAILFAAGPAKAQVVTFPDPNLEVAVEHVATYLPTNIERTDMLVLTNLNAAFDSIQNLSGLETASNLLTLDLGFNQLTNLSPLAGLIKLTQLHAGWNPLTDCSPLAGLTNLTYLDMNSDQLTDISPLGGLHKLALLVIPWNRVLDASPVAGLTNLLWLDIGGNRGPANSSITNVTALAGLKQIQWLSLYYLNVSDLSPLTGLTPLTNLDVSWNGAPANFTALNGLTNLCPARHRRHREQHRFCHSPAAAAGPGFRLQLCSRPFSGGGAKFHLAHGILQLPAHQRAAGDELSQSDALEFRRRWPDQCDVPRRPDQSSGVVG